MINDRLYRIRNMIVTQGILLSLICLIACHRSHPNTTLRVQFRDGQSVRLTLEEIDVKSVIPVDSAETGPGKDAIFNWQVNEASFYRIGAGNGKQMLLVVKPGDMIIVDASFHSFPDNVTVSGSGETLMLHTFMNASENNRRKADSIQKLLADHSDSESFAEIATASVPAFSSILRDQERIQKAFLRQHPSMLASLIVLNYGFGPRPVLPIDEHPQLYFAIDSALALTYPKNKHLIHHHKRILSFRNRPDTPH